MACMASSGEDRTSNTNTTEMNVTQQVSVQSLPRHSGR